MSEVPIIPMPLWFFEDVLYRSRNSSIILFVLMQKALNNGHDTIEASFIDIANWTGLHSPAISIAIQRLQRLGFLSKKTSGNISRLSTKSTKAEYQINWDAKGYVGQRVKSMYRKPYVKKPEEKPDLNNINDVLRKGEAVRTGRFGTVQKATGWYSTGYPGKSQAVEDALQKVSSKNYNGMRWVDFYLYFKEKYFDRFGVHYTSDMRGYVQQVLQQLIKQLGKEKLLVMVDWFVCVQDVIKNPTIEKMGSKNYFRKIYEGSMAWVRARAELDKVVL